MAESIRKEWIQTERLVREFGELVSIDSESFHERAMADRLRGKLEELGAQEIEEDGSAALTGSDAGNLTAYIPGVGERAAQEPLLFSAHMDTVSPGVGKKAVRQPDGRITSYGSTVLGADDLAGVCAILEALRVLRERNIAHRPVELLFATAEEAYVRGSKAFDYSKLRAKEAYVLDISGPVGAASLQEPTLLSFRIEMEGRAAHAGFAPETGIHAIAMAAKLIDKVPQGRVGDDTTVNIGTIRGGEGTNIVPPLVVMEGEIRSYADEKARRMQERIRQLAIETAGEYGGVCRYTSQEHLRAYRVEESEPVVQRFLSVCGQAGIPASLTKTFGGSDNNSFLAHGLRGIVLSCGMYGPHTTAEYTTVRDLELAAQIVAGLITA